VRLGTWQDRFIASLRRLGNVSRACKAAGVGRMTAYDHRDSDPPFAAQWRDALEESADWLEREAWRRAVKGVERPVYQQCRKVGTVREYSDTLLVQLLKANRPEKFRENIAHQHTGKDGGPIQFSGFDLSKLSTQELRALRDLRQKASVNGTPSDN
jgi:hypothetical protein